MKDRGDVERQERVRSGSVRDKELVDISWVARRLGVKERHVRRLVAERRIPLIKWGHLLRFDPGEIEHWIDEARRAPGDSDSRDHGEADGRLQLFDELPPSSRRRPRS